MDRGLRIRDVGIGALCIALGLGAAVGVVHGRGKKAAPCSLPRAPRPTPTGTLRVPRTTDIVLDGDFDDPGWEGCARTGAFVDENGMPARPHSEARLAWGNGMLFIGFYAGDQDIRSKISGVAKSGEDDGPLWLGDDLHLVLTNRDREYAIDVSPSGAVTDGVRVHGGPVDYTWQSEARVAHEMDGTLDDPSDDDEEWLVEIALPLTSLGLQGEPGERLGILLRRCDTSRYDRKSCGNAEVDHLELQ